MGIAKLISMVAQPIQTSFLTFEIGGILDTCEAKLGLDVVDISYQKLSESLRHKKTNANDPSKLINDSEGLKKLVQPFRLASLRNADRQAALDSAVNARQNAYYSKYAGSTQIISTIRGYYWKGSPTSKPNWLETLGQMAEQQGSDLRQAYVDDGREGVVKSTISSTRSNSSAKSRADRWQAFVQESVGHVVGGNITFPRFLPWPATGYASIAFTTGDPSQTVLTTGSTQDRTDSKGTTTGTQSSEHFDYEYRIPSLEAGARQIRARISLMDQQFESYMFGQNIPHLETVFENELNSIDNDVYQLQIALLRSYLMSPGPGVVTGVYKRPGEAVSAGEPIVRVEYNGVVQLIATVVHLGAIAIGATATVAATLAGGGGPTTPLTGSVVAARGAGDANRWEIVVELHNIDAGGNVIVPLGYVFDREYTAITIV